MKESLLFGVALIFVLGSVAQVVSWRFRLPSILLLLIFGVASGPIGLNWISPDEIFGDVLFPIVSLSVAVILFEGGLSLRFSELPGVRSVIFSLISLGMITTWAIGAWAANYFLGLDFAISVLLGAILTVSGPTVVIPMLRHVRPRPPLGEILKWEGILIDPVGAIAAVLVFEAIMVDRFHEATSLLAHGILHTLSIGFPIGIAAGAILAVAYRKHLVPEHLFNSVALMVVLGAYALSDAFHPESGLLSVTVAGIVLANVRGVDVRKVVEFKENLVVLLISSLFIILAARVSPEQLAKLDPLNSAMFLGVLLFVARPAAVGISTIGSTLNWQQRTFLAWLAPRGIVAAAVASVFSLQLESKGVEGAELLIPYTFLVIAGTVVVYGLTSGPMASLLKVSLGSPQGIIFMGANLITRAIAKFLQNEGYPVLLVDTNLNNIHKTRMEGIPATLGNILSDGLFHALELNEIGRFVAMTANHEANSLAAVKFSEEFGSQKVFQLTKVGTQKNKKNSEQPEYLHGRYLFDSSADYFKLDEMLRTGYTVKATLINDTFTFEDFMEHYESFLPVCVIKPDTSFRFITADETFEPKSGDRIVCLVRDTD